MKVMITGGAGFIARNLRELLASDAEVTCCTRRELDLLDTASVSDYLAAHRFDAVIHTATYDAAPKHSTKNPAMVLENNLRMFFGLARCHRYYGRMIYFGSGAEFDRLHWVPRMREDYFDQHVPVDQYGLSKYIMTQHVMRNPFNIYNLRLFGVFGKYDDWRTRFISNACCRVVMDMPVEMRQNRVFDHLYIEDLGRIVKWFLGQTPRHNVYNVCSGVTYDFFSLAGMITAAAGKDLPVIAKQTGVGPEYSGDNSLLLAELGDFKFTRMEDGIKSLYEWHAAHPGIIVRDEL